MGITHICENADFTYKILQYTCFNCICYTCSYDKYIWDMYQYNKLSDIQYASFQILPVDHHFGLFLVSWYPHHEHSREMHVYILIFLHAGKYCILQQTTTMVCAYYYDLHRNIRHYKNTLLTPPPPPSHEITY